MRKLVSEELTEARLLATAVSDLSGSFTEDLFATAPKQCKEK